MLDMLPRKLEQRGLDAALRCADICDLELYGSYDRSEFDAGRSPVMIWLLHKPGADAVVQAGSPPSE